MNSLIQLKGVLNERKSLGKPGSATLPKDCEVTIKDATKILDDLKELYTKWEKNIILNGALISAFYKRIVPKISIFILF